MHLVIYLFINKYKQMRTFKEILKSFVTKVNQSNNQGAELFSRVHVQA